MPFQPTQPFPKAQGHTIRSNDWNDLVNEALRLERDKVNKAGDDMTGPLTITLDETAKNKPVPDGWKDWIHHGFMPRETSGAWGRTIDNAHGMLVQGSSDFAFFGLKKEGEDRADAIIAWGDNPEGEKADHLRFLFGNHLDPAKPAEYMRITSKGNVGIGITNPAARLSFGLASGQALLVHQNDGANVRSGFGIDMTGQGRELNIFFPGGGNGGHLSIGTVSEDGRYTYSEKVRVTEIGNVGIGTPNPAGQLHLRTPTGNVVNSVFLESADANGARWGLHTFGASHSPERAGNLEIQDNTAASVFALTIQKGTGNVGIGTATPVSLLTVSGTNLGKPALTVVNNQNNGGLGGSAILIENPNAGEFGDAGVVFRIPAQDWFAGIDNNGADSFRINPQTDPSPSPTGLTITTSGNVGIGTTEPRNRLHIDRGNYSYAELMISGTGKWDPNVPHPIQGQTEDWNYAALNLWDRTNDRLWHITHRNEPWANHQNKLIFWFGNKAILGGAPQDPWEPVMTLAPVINQNGNVISGNVGIGTTGPNGKLDVANLVRFGLDEGGSGPKVITFTRDETDEANAGKIAYKPTWDPGVLGIVGAGGAGGARRKIRMWDDVLIDGYVGIGTPKPEKQMHVAGPLNPAYILEDTGKGRERKWQISTSKQDGGFFISEVTRPGFSTTRLFFSPEGYTEIGELHVGGDLRFTGNLIGGGKGGYVMDRFVNRLGADMEEGDVVIIEENQTSLYYDPNYNIPVFEIDLAQRAYDTRVCGVVCELYTELKKQVDDEIIPGLKTEKTMKRKANNRRSKTVPVHSQAFTREELIKMDLTKVESGQIGWMVTLGAFASCKVDADIASIKVGDLLTTSPTKGHAQKVLEPQKAVGAIIGKALGSLKDGKGKIPIIVLLQ